MISDFTAADYAFSDKKNESLDTVNKTETPVIVEDPKRSNLRRAMKRFSLLFQREEPVDNMSALNTYVVQTPPPTRPEHYIDESGNPKTHLVHDQYLDMSQRVYQMVPSNSLQYNNDYIQCMSCGTYVHCKFFPHHRGEVTDTRMIATCHSLKEQIAFERCPVREIMVPVKVAMSTNRAVLVDGRYRELFKDHLVVGCDMVVTAVDDESGKSTRVLGFSKQDAADLTPDDVEGLVDERRCQVVPCFICPQKESPKETHTVHFDDGTFATAIGPGARLVEVTPTMDTVETPPAMITLVQDIGFAGAPGVYFNVVLSGVATPFELHDMGNEEFRPVRRFEPTTALGCTLHEIKGAGKDLYRIKVDNKGKVTEIMANGLSVRAIQLPANHVFFKYVYVSRSVASVFSNV